MASDPSEPVTAPRLRTPRAAAVAGIVFALLLAAVFALLIVSVPRDTGTLGSWLTDSGRRTAVAVALNLVPFAGIAFLWFIGVVRSRVGEHEDKFFATVFLGSGLLFVAMLFVAAAFGGGLIAIAAKTGASPGADTVAVGRGVTAILLRVYALRMAAVFTISTATIALRTGVIPRWIGYLGVRVRRRDAGERRADAVGGTAVSGVDPRAQHRHPAGEPATRRSGGSGFVSSPT